MLDGVKNVFLTLLLTSEIDSFAATAAIQGMKHSPYLSDCVLADFFLFPHMKEAVAGQGTRAASKNLRKAQGGVTFTIAKKTFFTAAFRRW